MKPLPDDLLKAMCQASYDEKGRPFIVLDGERYFMPVLLAGAIADTWLGILRGIAVKQSQKVSDLEFDLRESIQRMP